MDERIEVISTRSNQKLGTKELICYIVGIIGGVVLLVYPGRLLYKIFGAAILLCEAFIFYTSNKDRKTFVTVYEDGIEGVGYDMKSNKLTEFSLRFKDIKRVRIKDAYLIIETKNVNYKCYALNMVNEVSLAISRRTKK